MRQSQLRKLRNDRNWTQRMLAEEIGTSHSIVSDWERGKRYPSRKNEHKLVVIFKQPIDYLLSQAEDSA